MRTHERMPSGDELHDAWKRSGLTQTELAALFFIHQATMNRWIFYGERPLPMRNSKHAIPYLLAFIELAKDAATLHPNAVRLAKAIEQRGTLAARAMLVKLGRGAEEEKSA